MRLVDVHARLSTMGLPAFRTSDAAAFLGLGTPHASKLLARLALSGHLVRLGRARWGFKDRIDPLALPEFLTSPYPSYVSLQSALFHHGMISQIPSVLYAVSPARTRTYRTPLGTVSVHHVQPTFFFGYESPGKGGGKIATAEKALVDFLYLGPARSSLFRALPELDLTIGFRISTARKIIRRIRSVRRRNHVARLFEELLEARPGAQGDFSAR